MDNKEEKTFADLFSSSTIESEEKSQTFGSFLKEEDESEKENVEIGKNNENIFEKSINLNDLAKKDEVKQVTFENNESINKDNMDLVNEKIEESIKQIKDESQLNPLFTNNNSEETEEQSSIEEKQETNANPFFQEESEKQSTIEEKAETDTNPFFQEDSSEKEIQIENKQEEMESLSKEESNFSQLNPLFTNSNSEEAEEQSSIEEKETDTNPFFQEESAEKGEQIENKQEEMETKPQEESNFSQLNPLFTNSNSEESEKQSTIEEKAETDTNPFFQEDSAEKESQIENKQEEMETNPQEESNFSQLNPLFTNSNSEESEEQSSIEEKQETNTNPFFKEDSAEKKAKEENKQEIKSVNPFFEEETEIENNDNPFLTNSINLVENNIPMKSINSLDTSKLQHFNVEIKKRKEPLFKIILGVISYAVFIWLLLIGVTLLVYVLDIKIRAAKGDYSAPKYNAYVVLTGSMLPQIQVNDVVITKKVDPSTLNEGDVITFASADSRFQGTIITHRIIKKNPPTDTEGYTFQTRGDNNNVADSALVPEANIYGKVIVKIPKLGYLQEFLASDGGWIIVILIPCLTVISYDIVKLGKGLKRKKNKNIKVQK
jgi:signal peptidase I